MARHFPAERAAALRFGLQVRPITGQHLHQRIGFVQRAQKAGPKRMAFRQGKIEDLGADQTDLVIEPRKIDAALGRNQSGCAAHDADQALCGIFQIVRVHRERGRDRHRAVWMSDRMRR
ncbi:MAG: hypothetical protein KGL12_02185 [Rhodospirillales bacterium]|nr:hypothetical protein [Rhodospirillales bacterium]